MKKLLGPFVAVRIGAHRVLLRAVADPFRHNVGGLTANCKRSRKPTSSFMRSAPNTSPA